MGNHSKKKTSSPTVDWHRQEVEQRCQAWLRDRERRGYFKDVAFKKWAETTAQNATETLVHLLRRYRIEPFDVLEILALHKTEEWFATHLSVRKKLPSAKLREKDAKALNTAVSILDEWRSYLTQETHAIELEQYPNIEHLNLVAKTLRDLGPAQRHNQPNVRLRCCAQRLAEAFQNSTGWKKQLYEHIGALMDAAFRKDWGTHACIRDAAMDLVKGWDLPIRWIDERNYPIWIVDNRLTVVHVNQSAGRLLGVLPWKLAGKNVNVLIQALLTKMSTNDSKIRTRFERDYVKFLKGRLIGRGFEWPTTLTLEREVTNKFYEKEKQIVDYDFLVQREIGARANEGTRTYLTEKEPVPKDDT